ncbi:hypothetical protein ACWGVR_38700 [Streptomyces xanthophaeus]
MPFSVLLWLAKKTGKHGYIEHCKAARVDDDGKATSELTGPGSTRMELDAALHRAIGIAAAAVPPGSPPARREISEMASAKATNPPRGECHAVLVSRARQP